MLIVIRQVLAREDALALGRSIAAAQWVDGNVTSGDGAALAKRNRQLPEDSDVARDARRAVQRALAASGQFLSAALPRAIYPPLFNRYGIGEGFGAHVDNAIRVDPASGGQMRTDLSATLFLSEDYDGGELLIEGGFGTSVWKCPAGDMILYPSSSLHSVSDVTRGERIASFFWLQSLVRDHGNRESLFDLDQSVQALAAERGGDDPQVLRLTKVYHNLVRGWAEAG